MNVAFPKKNVLKSPRTFSMHHFIISSPNHEPKLQIRIAASWIFFTCNRKNGPLQLICILPCLKPSFFKNMLITTYWPRQEGTGSFYLTIQHIMYIFSNPLSILKYILTLHCTLLWGIFSTLR